MHLKKRSRNLIIFFSSLLILFLIVVLLPVFGVRMVNLPHIFRAHRVAIKPVEPDEFASLTVPQLIEKAGDYFQVGEYDKSTRAYELALQKDGNAIGALAGRANLYRYHGQYAEAEKLLLKAVSVAPKNGWLHIELGKLYRNYNKHAEAEAEFAKAEEVDPTNDQIYSYGLGYLYRDEGKLDLSLQMFQKALDLNPSYFNYMGMGDIYRELKKYDESEKMFKKSIELNPKSEAYLGLGYLYLQQDKLPQAEAAFKGYLENIRTKSEVYYGLGLVYQKQNKPSDAERMFIKSADLNPQVGAYDMLAALYHTQGRTEDEQAILNKKAAMQNSKP